MVGPGETLGSPWIPLPVRACPYYSNLVSTKPPSTESIEAKWSFNSNTGKPRFNKSKGTEDFVLYSRDFVIVGAFYYSINYRET
jgi:hypothetical protein